MNKPSRTSRTANAITRGVAVLALVGGSLASASAARAASTFVVDSTGDQPDANTADGACDIGTGKCTLRAAIMQANVLNDADTILIDIPAFGVPTIKPATPLPAVTQPVTIDGTGEPLHYVQLSGANAGAGATGLQLSGGNTTVRGMIINRFYFGILIDTAGDDVVAASISGTNLEGDAGIGNTFGIDVRTGGNLVGGTGSSDGNLIGGNSTAGIQVESGTGNVIQGNLVGTDGHSPIVNTYGILDFGSGTTIGGTAPGAGNVVSGNSSAGISTNDSGMVVQGNLVGTDSAGTEAVPNSVGVGATGGLIGGVTSGARNVISGNSSRGILLSGGATTVQGNLIGTDVTGAASVPNGIYGIYDGSSSSVIGGTTAAARNVVSGNKGEGIFLLGSGTTVQGNFVGTDITGTKSLGNTYIGVYDYGTNTLVGGTAPGAGNVLSGNGEYGVFVGADSNTVQGNRIGTDVSATRPLPNKYCGARVWHSSISIGGVATGAGNVIAFNGGAGVCVDANSAGQPPTVLNNPVRGNSIFDNGGLGIDIDADGVTPNDAGDADTGPNNRQNFPSVDFAATVGGSTEARGSLSSTPSATFTLDFYASPACDPAYAGEGKRYLGSASVTTGSGGSGTFDATLPKPTPSGWTITATATDGTGNTSEFSGCAVLQRVAGADFNGDGRGDLAVGVPGEDVGSVVDAGAVSVLYGASGSGLSSANNQLWTQDSAGVPDASETADAFGSAVAWADFNGDGYDDLAVGIPKENLSGAADGGAIEVLLGSALGLTGVGSELWRQGSGGVLGSAASGDQFGSSLGVGDFNGDGYADIGVGVPGEDVGAATDAGAAAVLYGSPTGVGASGNQLWTQNTGTILDSAEIGDAFGTAIVGGDFNGDHATDLAIGVPLEDAGSNVDTGTVNVIYGSDAGLIDTGNQTWTQDSGTVIDKAEAGDHFGATLASTDLYEHGFADLAVGVPLEDLGTIADAGAVNVFVGGAAGLTDLGNQFWTQNSAGVLEKAEAGDRFGSALAYANFNGDDGTDLAIGVPGEDAGTTADAGAVNVLYANFQGLSANGNQLWRQGAGGIVDSMEQGDVFGSALATGDFQGDTRVDLAVGVPGEDSGAGAAAVLYGDPLALVSTGNQLWRQGSAGVLDSAEVGDSFGSALG